jgi:hypothetical protein
MKTISITLITLGLLFGSTQFLSAQKKSFTGKVTYKISFDMSGLPPEARGMMPTTMAMYIGTEKVKTEIITVMGNQSTILNMKEKTHTTLMDIMGQKLAIRDTYEELMNQVKDAPEYKIVETSETKEIAGYNCKKMLIKKVNAEGNEVDEGQIWLADNLNLHPDFYFNQPAYKNLNGLMMEYEMDTGNNMKMKLTAVEVSWQKVKDSEFEIPAQYEIITREELNSKISW